ncbi:hypothetical protein [Halorubrum salinum]|uniref:hypothetical protein n=1 Tax=Halorubrum salinum TaxID=767517 RepID=UPI002110FFB5|nr:hypothetical protein [Halorubrum salinum]
MATRDQLTDERVRALITELGNAGIIHEDEAGQLAATREFEEASEVRESTPKPPAVTRTKVSAATHQEFQDARTADDLQTQIDLIWHVLTGRDPSGGG